MIGIPIFMENLFSKAVMRMFLQTACMINFVDESCNYSLLVFRGKQNENSKVRYL